MGLANFNFNSQHNTSVHAANPKSQARRGKLSKRKNDLRRPIDFSAPQAGHYHLGKRPDEVAYFCSKSANSSMRRPRVPSLLHRLRCRPKTCKAAEKRKILNYLTAIFKSLPERLPASSSHWSWRVDLLKFYFGCLQGLLLIWIDFKFKRNRIFWEQHYEDLKYKPFKDFSVRCCRDILRKYLRND